MGGTTVPSMTRGLVSWPLPLGIGVGAALLAAGLGPGVAIGVGVALWAGLGTTVSASKEPRRRRPPRIDPFAVGEPWRQFVSAAHRSADRLHATVADAADGPTKDRLTGIVERLDHGVEETWRIARSGDRIDDAVRRLDPTALRSQLSTLRAQQDASPSDDLTAAIASVESQLATTDRLKERSAKTADTLRLAQARLDELVTRSAEISIGAGDTEAYEHDVDDLVIELEALRQAIQEVEPG